MFIKAYIGLQMIKTGRGTQLAQELAMQYRIKIRSNTSNAYRQLMHI